MSYKIINYVYENNKKWNSFEVIITQDIINNIYKKEKNNLEKIKAISQNEHIKSFEEHLTTTLLGKTAEFFLLHLFKKELHLTEKNIIHSKVENGYELFDFLLSYNNINLTCELRTSFIPDNYQNNNNFLNLSHIGYYINNFKKTESKKDLYFQMLWNNNRKNLIKNITNWYHNNIFENITLKYISFCPIDLLEKIGKNNTLNQSNTIYTIIRPLTSTISPVDLFEYLKKSLNINNKLKIKGKI